jgi:microcompartment protein CcmL/EutN
MPPVTRGPALGVLEIATIARGVVAADAGLKRAPAVLLASRAVSGGKHLVMFEGGVAEVEEAMAAGMAAAGDQILDRVWLPAADDQVWPLLGAPVAPMDWSGDAGAEAVAVVETATVCAAIAAADAAC